MPSPLIYFYLFEYFLSGLQQFAFFVKIIWIVEYIGTIEPVKIHFLLAQANLLFEFVINSFILVELLTIHSEMEFGTSGCILLIFLVVMTWLVDLSDDIVVLILLSVVPSILNMSGFIIDSFWLLAWVGASRLTNIIQSIGIQLELITIANIELIALLCRY